MNNAFKDNLFVRIRADDSLFSQVSKKDFTLPDYDPLNHSVDIAEKPYYRALTILRHNIKIASDFFFATEQKAYNVDLFMMTPSVSSPMGPGSDSEAVSIQLGNLRTNLVDSSQFGFEPLLMNNIDRVYCYLPSMRGEDADKRHLNQFYHCETEIKGSLSDLLPIAEGYVKFLCTVLLEMPNICSLISQDPVATNEVLRKVVECDSFTSITFDNAVKTLNNNGLADTVNSTEAGSDIKSEGEIALVSLLGTKIPIWISNYDRDRVPFYQKPDSSNKDKVINADLIFPPLTKNSFGGEILGCGQRQDNVVEMYESLERQGIDPITYEWYIQLRNLEKYSTTSGFGLGIERFLAWALCIDDIKKVILYPRIKNLVTYP